MKRRTVELFVVAACVAAMVLGPEAAAGAVTSARESPAAPYTLTPGVGEGLIDPLAKVQPPTVSFETNVFLFTSAVVVHLDRPTARRVRVSFTTTDGPPAAILAGQWVGSASSFTPRTGTITVAPGSTSATFTFAVTPLPASDCDILAANCWPSATVTLGKAVHATVGSPSSANVFASP
jgi:hypothetical protein